MRGVFASNPFCSMRDPQGFQMKLEPVYDAWLYVPGITDDLRPRPAETIHKRYAKNSTIPVSRLYIEPAIFILPLDSRSRSTELFFRMLAIVSDTFFRATASTNA